MLGGAFHVGVEVHGKEIFFGSEGVDTCEPKGANWHVFRQTVSMGRTPLSREQVGELVRQMGWNGNDYDILRRNCCSFADELCEKLVGRGVPGWVDRFPQVAAAAVKGLQPVVDLSALVRRLTQL